MLLKWHLVPGLVKLFFLKKPYNQMV